MEDVIFSGRFFKEYFLDSAALLRSHNIKPTVIRLKVYDYLRTRKNHPTADKLFRDLQKDIPTLSKTSVYNATGLLLQKELVRTVTIEENELRYDADISDHGHFKCTACFEVFDFSIDLTHLKYNLPEDFEVTDRQLLFHGICSDCRKRLSIQ